MTAPSKLAVEIAEALNRKLSGILTAETVTALAALIDAKLAPLVEDRAILGWATRQIAVERRRQVSDEKYGPWHDDEHTDGSLRVVAAKLCCEGTDAHVEDSMDRDDWTLLRHPLERRLVIAAALIAAEMDRIQRAKDYVRQEPPTSQPADQARAQRPAQEGGE